MTKVGMWQITDDGPHRVSESQLDLEKNLENWIETDPSLLQTGLTVVGRQVVIEGGVIDLLALDPQGRWIIIEIKRGLLRRDTIAQIIDYASCLASMSTEDLVMKTNQYLNEKGETIEEILEKRSAQEAIAFENRDILLTVVGIGKAPGLERMTSYLSEQFQLPISVVSFTMFEARDKSQILARELSEPEQNLMPGKQGNNTIEQVCQIADKEGMGKEFRAILSTAQELGLYSRPYKKSIMYTPPFQRNRMLFTVWTSNYNDRLKLYAGPAEFVEFYSISEDVASQALNIETSSLQMMNKEQIQQFLSGLKKLFLIIENHMNRE